MNRLLGLWAVLLVVVQAVTVSQTESQPKSVSAVVSASAETLGMRKAAADDSKPSFMSLVRKPDSDNKNTTAPQKVDIDVYYETRCPGCLLFLNRTLEPLWRKRNLREVFNINMYTYGNGMTVPVANISDGYKFWHPDSTGKGWKNVQICQHGNDECLGNLVQVCVKNITDHEKHMDLIFCMTASTIAGYGVEKSTYECMEKVGIDKDKVRDCVTSPRGDELVTAAGAQTRTLKGRLGTPWVLVGGQHVADNILMNSTLLLQSVCQHVNNAPVPCAPFHNMPQPTAQKEAEPADPDFTVLQDVEAADLLKVSKV